MSTSRSTTRLLLQLAARLSSSRGRAPASSWAWSPAVAATQQPHPRQQRGYAAQSRSRSGVGGDSDGDAARLAPTAVLTPASPAREPETPLLRSIRNRIMIRGGPLTLAEYMSEVLTNPLSGYYTSAGGEAGAPGAAASAAAAPAPGANDAADAADARGRSVFGSRGDFVTSPEISQLFGEMVCVWSLALWLSQGRPERVRLVELGPGRGTLMADVLRAARASFPPFAAAVRDVRLVELSPALRAAQWRTLECERLVGAAEAGPGQAGQPPTRGVSRLLAGAGAAARRGVPVAWHASLDEVPGRVRVKEGTADSGAPEFVVEPDDDDDEDDDDGYRQQVEEEEEEEEGRKGAGGGEGRGAAATKATKDRPPFATIYIAHEFFDALPVHQFQYAPARGSRRSKGGSSGVGVGRVNEGGGGLLVSSGRGADQGGGDGDGGCWLERMVDIVPDDDEAGAESQAAPPPSSSKDGLHLRFVLSPSPTPAAALLVPRRLAALTAEQCAALASSSSSPSSSSPSASDDTSSSRPTAQQVSAIEISAHAMALAEALALRVGFSSSAKGGNSGAALILDYGRAGPYAGSLTAVRAHAQHPHPLSLPGAADLSAWVDFSALAQAAAASGAPVHVHGPVAQGAFLGALGARERAEALAVAAADAAADAAAARGEGRDGMEREARRAAEAVAVAYRRLVGGGHEGMGETYKALAIVPVPGGLGVAGGGGSGERAGGGEGGGGAAGAAGSCPPPVGFGGGVEGAAL